MKKFSLILLFILGFFVVFAVSAVITFTLTIDRDEPATEATTEAAYIADSLAADSEIEAEMAVTRVTPSLSVADAIIVKTVYGDKAEEEEVSYEIPEIAEVEVIEEVIAEVTPVVEEKKAEVKKEEVKVEAPKTEEKKEEVKAEEPKSETKKEEVKAEMPKAEEKVEEVKAEEPVVEEKAEEKPVVLDPNKQYSDTGI